MENARNFFLQFSLSFAFYVVSKVGLTGNLGFEPSPLSVEFEYKAMTQSMCEITWLRQHLVGVSIKTSVPTKLWCDNQAALHITSNRVYHE